jgi:hypothetical protein
MNALDVFLARTEARAILCAEGLLELQQAVDALQAHALANGLVAALGQDQVQRVLAAAFEASA